MTRTNSLKNIAVLACAVLLAAGALALTGCGEQEQQGTTVQSATPAASQPASSDNGAGEGEQDNCYGDDLPVINNN